MAHLPSPRKVAEAALSHAVTDALERAHARPNIFDERRKMMQDWAACLAARWGEVVGFEATK